MNVLRALAIILFSLISIVGFAKDDIIVRGTVLEATGFHAPVVSASIRVLSAADSTLVTAASADQYMYDTYVEGATNNQKRYTGGFSVNLPRTGQKYIFMVTAVGYKPTTVDVDLSQIGKKIFSLKLDPIYLAPKTEILDEVVVKASKVKFYNRGDTLVYNADAFNLAEGSMLDALIRQLPNVVLKENGSIYVNGRYVDELLLNGKHFFDGNKQLMLQNLASYTVQNIEVYDKLGDASELAGINLGDSQFVMDVKLKKQYMVGTMLNMEGGYGSEDRYLGRLFAMAFTPTSQYAAYFNINNLNDSRKPGQQTTWTPETMPTGIQKIISGGVDYNIKPVGGHWELSGNVNAESTRETDYTQVVRTNYLVTNRTYDYQFKSSGNRLQTWNTRHKIYYKASKNYGIRTEPFLTYKDWENRGEDVNATFSEEFNQLSAEFIKNIYNGNNNGALTNLINRHVSTNRQKGHSLSTGTKLWQGFKLPGTHNMLEMNLFGKYDNRHDEKTDHYDINFGQEPTPAKTANRHFKNHPDFASNLGAEISYSFVVARAMTLGVSYRYEHNYRKETSDLFRLESPEAMEDFMFGKLPSAIDYESSTLDRSNSYLSRSTDNNHQFALEYFYSLNGFYIQYKLPIIAANQKLDYQRGNVDTTFTRRSALLDIGNAMFIWENKIHRIAWTWGLKSRTPDMVSMVDFTDATDPLYIRKGNRDLKNAEQFDTKLSYWYTNKEKKHRMGVEGKYSILSNALSQGYTYDTHTGVREASYYNVNGNWSAEGSAFYRKMKNGWLFVELLGMGHSTNVDLVGENSPRISRSKVYNLNFHDRLMLEYSFGKHKIGLNVEGKHDRFTSNRQDFTNQNTWTVQSGLNAIVEFSDKMQLATDFTVYNRRGYTDKALNTDNFVWNARLTYKLMKGKLLFMLDGYDILHDLSNVSYTMNAQGRTETYRTVLPRYFLCHIQWRFNHSPKSKNK